MKRKLSLSAWCEAMPKVKWVSCLRSVGSTVCFDARMLDKVDAMKVGNAEPSDSCYDEAEAASLYSRRF